jgi:diacylglycerol kinase (ATP)
MTRQLAEPKLPTSLEPVPDPPTGDVLRDLEAAPIWTPRAGRRSTREKFTAGLRGLKHAIRGDSSFFAHAYRGTLIGLTAALIHVDGFGWCLLVIAACFVLLAELTHSAIDSPAPWATPKSSSSRSPARSRPAACSWPRSSPGP